MPIKFRWPQDINAIKFGSVLVWSVLNAGVITTVSGTSPLSLANALAKNIVSLTQYGLCTQASTPAPSSPVDIKCNNGAIKWDSVNQRIYADDTPEVLAVLGKNLLDPATNVTGSYIYANGEITADDDAPPKSQYTALIPVVAGEKYTWSLKSYRALSANNRWHGYDSSGEWVQQIAFDPADTGGAAFTLTATIPSGVSYVRLSYGATDKDAQFELGESATEYEAYSAQTASVADLFAAGDYKDEQDIISGLLTHRVGIRVFDGTEEWTTDTYGGYRRMVLQEVLNASGDTLLTLCSHYASRAADVRQQPNSIFIASSGKLVIYVDSTQNISTVEEFNTWLASEYANGTPVIVVYPLAQETTETVTGHTLRTTEGNNTITVDAEVDDINLEVTYYTTE